jgi:acetyl esterase/lipase
MNCSLSLFVALACLSAATLAAQDGQPFQTKASDGRPVSGKVYGESDTALILCHGRMYTDGADSFAEECRHFQAQGVMCLAVHFRGYPAASPAMLPGQHLDVAAAFDYAVQAGAKRVFVLGSSMGGFAVLKALRELSSRPQLAGIVILSAFDVEACKAAACSKLFVVAKDDARLYPEVMAMAEAAAPPKQPLVFPTGGHGQQLFKTRRDELLKAILAFMAPQRAGGGN